MFNLSNSLTNFARVYTNTKMLIAFKLVKRTDDSISRKILTVCIRIIYGRFSRDSGYKLRTYGNTRERRVRALAHENTHTLHTRRLWRQASSRRLCKFEHVLAGSS